MLLNTLLGDHPVTSALKSGQVRSTSVASRFADVKVPIRPSSGSCVIWSSTSRKRFGAIQINHMIAVRSSMDRSVSREVLELLEQSRQRAGNPEMNPFGVDANRRNLEVAIDCVYGQRMIPQRFTVDELFAWSSTATGSVRPGNRRIEEWFQAVAGS